MNLNDNKFFNSTDVYVSSRMNEYLKKNFGYVVEGDLETLEEAKQSLQAEQVKLKKNSYMSNKYMENMLMIETITSLLKAHGEDTTSSYDHQEVTEETAEFSDKQIKMAFGVLNDPRYKDGNYSGAVATIEKIAKGLSTHPSVANALKRANESAEEVAEKKKSKNFYPNFKETLEAIDSDLSQTGDTTTSDASPETEQVAEDEDRAHRIEAVMRKGGYTDFQDLLTDIMHYAQETNKDFGMELDRAKSEFLDQHSESIKEDDEEEKGPDHYRWKNDSQLSIAKDKLEQTMEELVTAINYREDNKRNLMSNGDKAGSGDLYRMLDKLRELHDNWDENTKYYGM